MPLFNWEGPIIYKICSRCGKRIPEGTTCPCQKIRKAESDKHYDKYQRDQKSTEFYKSGVWQLTRQRVLNMDQHLDVYEYMMHGRVVIADTVHHIVPLKEDWNRRLDLSNLMSLNHDTHSTIERDYEKYGSKVMACRLQEILGRYRDQMSPSYH